MPTRIQIGLIGGAGPTTTTEPAIVDTFNAMPIVNVTSRSAGPGAPSRVIKHDYTLTPKTKKEQPAFPSLARGGGNEAGAARAGHRAAAVVPRRPSCVPRAPPGPPHRPAAEALVERPFHSFKKNGGNGASMGKTGLRPRPHREASTEDESETLIEMGPSSVPEHKRDKREQQCGLYTTMFLVCCLCVGGVFFGFESALHLMIDRTAVAATPPNIVPVQRPCPTPSIWGPGRLYTKEDIAPICVKGARKNIFVWLDNNDFDSSSLPETPQQAATRLSRSEQGVGRYFWGLMLGADAVVGTAYPHSVTPL